VRSWGFPKWSTFSRQANQDSGENTLTISSLP
jgi:hypothetical protein